MSEPVILRPAVPADSEALADLYRGTILTVNRADYDSAQVRAWAGRMQDTARLLQRISEQYFLVAERHGEIAGFGSLTADGTHLDLLFVHRDHQRRGVAQTICDALLGQARAQGVPVLTADVSITARPFFEKQGFVVRQPREVVVDGVTLVNYRMIREL